VILALVTQNCKKSRDPEYTPYCGMLTRIVVVLITISLHTKFDMSSFIHSKERENLEVSHITLTPD